MSKYVIKTPSEIYNGVTAGVQFVNGIAEVEDKDLRDYLVYGFGYADVTPEEAPAKPKAEDKPSAKTSSK